MHAATKKEMYGKRKAYLPKAHVEEHSDGHVRTMLQLVSSSPAIRVAVL